MDELEKGGVFVCVFLCAEPLDGKRLGRRGRGRRRRRSKRLQTLCSGTGTRTGISSGAEGIGWTGGWVDGCRSGQREINQWK